MEFKAKLKELLEVEITDESLNYRPLFSWEKLMTDTSRGNLTELLSWAVEEIKKYERKLGEQ